MIKQEKMDKITGVLLAISVATFIICVASTAYKAMTHSEKQVLQVSLNTFDCDTKDVTTWADATNKHTIVKTEGCMSYHLSYPDEINMHMKEDGAYLNLTFPKEYGLDYNNYHQQKEPSNDKR